MQWSIARPADAKLFKALFNQMENKETRKRLLGKYHHMPHHSFKRRKEQLKVPSDQQQNAVSSKERHVKFINENKSARSDYLINSRNCRIVRNVFRFAPSQTVMSTRNFSSDPFGLMWLDEIARLCKTTLTPIAVYRYLQQFSYIRWILAPLHFHIIVIQLGRRFTYISKNVHERDRKADIALKLVVNTVTDKLCPSLRNLTLKVCTL